jgi:two-component system, OmpR family, phosphate regulon sensor histidine kinase PhoR
LKSIRNNLISSRVVLKQIFVYSAVFFFILTLVFPLSGIKTLVLFVFIVLLDFFILIYTGKNRINELETIKEVIHSIRKNEIISPGEIILNENLASLQEEIKAMFFRTQNDIENLKKLERIRTEFLGNVSHELRTPIFAIQGFLETLLNGAIDDPKVNRSFLEKANRHTENLNHLLNDLIDISMIESGEMRMSFRYFPVKEFLDNITAGFISLAEDKKLLLTLYPVDEHLEVLGDKNKLTQVLSNLIQNAIKYTEQGKVEIITEEDSKFVKFIIKDTGIGISQENLGRIFERFFRVDKDRSRLVGGTGLGLAIAKHIIEAHGSKIEVESEPGKGSLFSFKLKK